MKKYCYLLILIILFTYVLSQQLNAKNIFAECSKRCEKLTGLSKHRCLSTCAKTSKRSKYKNNRRTNQNIKDCEEVCKVYKGTKNVQCLRVCLERIKVKDRHDPSDINNYSEECQKRCRRMPEKLRYKCLIRCKRSEKKSKGRDSSKRSVW